MDTRVFCVYNLSRGVLLSSKVTVADGANQPLKILKVLVGGMGVDPESGLWLSPLCGLPPVPRLFPFDVLYLDKDLQVLDSAEMVPGVEFPPYHREVASALILPHQTVHSTQTGQGDPMIICHEDDVEGQIASFEALASAAAPPRPSRGEHGGQSPSGRIETGPRGILGGLSTAADHAGAVAVAEEVLPVAAQSAMAASALEASVRSVPAVSLAISVADRVSENEASAVQAREAVQPNPAAVSNGTDGAETESPVEVFGQSKEPGISKTIPEPIAAATPDATKTDIPAGEVQSPALPKTPVMAITEVVLERPRIVQPQVIVGAQGGVDDLFSNWVDAPSLTWTARRAEQAKPQVVPPVAAASVPDPLAAAKLPEAVIDPSLCAARPSPELVAPPDQGPEQAKEEREIKQSALKAAVNQQESGKLSVPSTDSAAAVKAESRKDEAPSNPVPAPAKTESPAIAPLPASIPTRVALPQLAQATTYTAAKYGLWRVSIPTAVIPVVPAKSPIEERPAAPAVSAPSSPVAEIAADATTAELSKATDTIAMPESLTSAAAPPPQNVAERPENARTQGSAEVQTASRVATAKSENTKQNALSAVDTTPSNAANVTTVAAAPAAKEKVHPAFKVSRLAVQEKSPRTEVVQPSTELPDSLVARAGTEVASKAVEKVQRKLGIGQAKVPAAVVPVAVQRVEEAPDKKTVDTKPAELAKGAAAKEPGGKKDSAATSRAEVSLTLPLPSIRQPEQKGKLKISIQRVEANGKTPAPAPSLGTRFKRWLNPVAPASSDRRRAHRRYVPGMIAHYYNGGAPKPWEGGDISMTGFYLLTDDRWMPETMIQMTLQKPCAKGERKQSITVLSRIVRRASDGVAAEFVMPETLDPHSHDVQPSQTTDRFALARFI